MKLWSLLLLQIIAIAALDGAHAFIHSYYFIGLSFTSALLWSHYYHRFEHLGKTTRIYRVTSFLLAAGIVLFNIEHSFYELREGVYSTPHSVQTLWASCKELKLRHPEWPWNQGYSFRSKIDPISDIGFCFGEIQSSEKSLFGFFAEDEAIPADCAPIDQAGPVRLVKCNKVDDNKS